MQYHRRMQTHWRGIQNRLQAELEKVKGPVPFPIREITDYDEFAKWLFEEETDNSEEVERAIARFCIRGTWPNVSVVARYMIGLRLQFAIYILQQMLTPSRKGVGFVTDVDPMIPDGEIVSWLLSDLWAEWNGAWLKLVALYLAKKTSLFGLDPRN